MVAKFIFFVFWITIFWRTNWSLYFLQLFWFRRCSINRKLLLNFIIRKSLSFHIRNFPLSRFLF
nr:MAG TPA: hypothetical protein [Bacteriophage sp.]